MRNILIISLVGILFSTAACAEVKKADLAGTWYPDSGEALSAELQTYLDAAETPKVSGKLVALISPHAGFRYSGPVAAYGFKTMQGKNIKTVVVVGFSHRRHYDGIAVLDADGFETPLGTAAIDREITKELIEKDPKIYNYPIAFSDENSVEMQIPFLQFVLKDFKIVLIAIGSQSLKNCEILGRSLYDVVKNRENYVLVASTDMSHYLPYDEANEIDAETNSLIERLDPKGLYAENSIRGHRLMCGYGAVCATMITSEMLGANTVEILKYANSGDTAGDKRKVVGYLSAAVIASEAKQSQEIASSPREVGAPRNDEGKEKGMLNEAQRKKMLKLARDTIVHYVNTGERLEVTEEDPILNKEMGAFVTLHKHGQLRGCIGNMVGRGPFYLTVRDMAIAAATNDPRFRDVTPEEIGEIDIEISALSPLEKIDDPEKIEMGKHGVIVRSAFASGVYLPQVATETGWNREQFMNSLCGQKAGMPPDAWKKGACDIYIFTAEVFGEK